MNASDSEEQEDDAAEENAAGGAERLVLLVEGPKRVGKSTFTKMLLNRLLSRCAFPPTYSVDLMLTLALFSL